MDKFELFNNDLLFDDYETVTTNNSVVNIRDNKSFGLRGNIVLTSLFLGSSILAQANDMNNYQVFDNTTRESIECSERIGNDISSYVNKINYINKNHISKYNIIESILSFKSLNDNWDGFKAIPLEVKCATNAILLLDLVGDDAFCTVKDFYPNPNGTITFEWYNQEDESVFLEVGNNTFSYYVSFNSIETKYFNKQVINEENSELLSTFIKAI